MKKNTKKGLSYLKSKPPAQGTGEEIFPGIHWLRMPLPFDLDHINLWLLDDGDAYTLVDTGLAVDIARDAWEGLFTSYLKDKPITRIIVTHHHPDHIGLAKWLSERFSCEFCMTDLAYQRTDYLLNTDSDEEKERIMGFYSSHGVDDTEFFVHFCMGYHFRKIISGLPAEYTPITEGQEIRIGNLKWRVLIVHGHAEGHLSLYCEELGVFISGDQVLPGISTNVSIYPYQSEGDSLQYYLDSLESFRCLPKETYVLPSHGKVFQGLHNRISALEAHHEEQLNLVYELCESARTANDLMPDLFGRELSGLHRILGFGETLAHLIYLENRGRLKRREVNGRYEYISV